MANEIIITSQYLGEGAVPQYAQSFVPAGGGTGGAATTTLPIATDTILGGIMVGSGLTITTGGTLSATGGGISAVGTPADNQIAIWKTADTIEGSTGFTFLDNGKVFISGGTYTSIYEPDKELNVYGKGIYLQGHLEMAPDKTIYMGCTSDSGSRLNLKQRTGGIDDGAYFDYYPKLQFRSGENSSINRILFETDGTINADIQKNNGVYTSGYFGSGYKLNYTGGISSLEIDDLIVRRKLSAYELEIREISSIGGSLVVSVGNATIYDISGSNLIIDTDNNRNPIQFAVGDIVRGQVFTGRGTDSYIGTVTNVTQSATLGSAFIQCSSSDTPWIGMKLVVVGSNDNARNNLIYLTSADSNNPYISFLRNVTGATFVGHEACRIGNLSGIVDPDFGGNLSGFGLYADNIYLKGQIVITNTIPYSSISSTPTIPTNTNQLTDGANLGGTATWNGVSSKPTGASSLVSTPTGSGLMLDGTHLGYYTGGAWTTYMDNNGNFSLGNTNTGAGLTWNQSLQTLLVRGDLLVESVGGWSVANDAIFVGTKKTDSGFTTSGITLASNGTLRSTGFEIGTNGMARFSAVDSQLATLPYVDGTLSGTVAYTQANQAKTNRIDRITNTGYAYDSNMSCNGYDTVIYWDTDESTTMQNFYINEYSNFYNYGVFMIYDTFSDYIDLEAVDGDFTEDPEWTNGSVTTIQAYVAGVQRIDTITLTGSGGIADVLCDGYTEGAFGLNGVSCVWQGSLAATATWFDEVYSAGYSAGGVILTHSGNDLIFTSAVAGVNFAGATSISHETAIFLGNIKLESNEIWEDSIDSDTTSVLKINYRGYKHGDTRNRITMIGGGHGSSVVIVSGEDVSGLNQGLTVRQGAIMFPRHTDTTRNALTKTPGMVIWNNTNNRLEVVNNSNNWVAV